MSALLYYWFFGQILTSVSRIRLCLRRQQVGSGSIELGDHLHLSTTEITQWFSSLLWAPAMNTELVGSGQNWHHDYITHLKKQDLDKLLNLETVEHHIEGGWMDGWRGRMPWCKIIRAIFSLCLFWPDALFTQGGEESQVMTSHSVSRFKHVKLATEHKGAGKQHPQGSVRRSPLMTCQRSDMQGSVIMENTLFQWVTARHVRLFLLCSC